MGTFTKESLEQLRTRIDLIEAISPYVKLQRSGASYKALCPFHEERTPSFVIQKGDRHYHCFGCGAHGDAIGFLMTHLRMTFSEAVESLAERFQVSLEEVQGGPEKKGPSKTVLKEVLEKACTFYQFYLLHTLEGHDALDYLYHRGIDLEWIRKFHLGLSPKAPLLLKWMEEEGVSRYLLEEVGLCVKGREFFSERIMIPIRDAMGGVIGFSARKFKPSTFGGKYINTGETTLFKKSKVLFGLSFCRKEIAKTRKVLIVEGQIDALRLIHCGFAWTVAGQGTAFGEDQAKELIQLGVRQVYLALDSDDAGQAASAKIGNFFQKEGVDVFVLSLDPKSDPDTMLQERGPEDWQKRIETSADYLTFLVEFHSRSIQTQSPAGKNELVQRIAKQVREWDHPLMIHESLRKLARLTQTPEELLAPAQQVSPQIYVKKSASITFTEIDPDRILEADLLRWLFLMGEEVDVFVQIATMNLSSEHFRLPAGRDLFTKYLQVYQEKKPRDLLSLAIDLEQAQAQLFMAEILQKRVNRERALTCFVETVQKMLDRFWMHQREEIKQKIYSGKCTEAEVLDLAKQFDALKKNRPQVQMPEGVLIDA